MKSTNIILCLLALLIVIGGLSIDFAASSMQLEYSQVSRLDNDGKKIVENIVSVPKSARLCALFAACLNAVGISILVSVLVVSQVEKAQRDSINRELFSSVFKRMIPEELFTVIYDDILRSSVIQKGAHWHLNYSKGVGDEILLTRTITYSLVNISNQPFRDKMKSLLIRRLGEEGFELVRAQWTSQGIVVVDYDAERPGKEKGVLKFEENGKTHISYEISIPARSHISATLVLKSSSKQRTNDSMFGNRPIMDLRITANYPEDMVFSWHSSTSSEIECLDHGDTSTSLKANGAILPKQGFIFRLDPKSGRNQPDEPAGN